MSKLHTLQRSSNGEVIPVNKRLVFGKDGSACDIVLNHPSASRRQFQISIERGQVFVLHLGGPQGTFVNNERVSEDIPKSINNGDRISYGASVQEVFLLGESKVKNEKLDRSMIKLDWLKNECDRIRAKEGAEGLTENQTRTLERYEEEMRKLEKIIADTIQASNEPNANEDADGEGDFWDVPVPEDSDLDARLFDLTDKKAKSKKVVETYDSLRKKLAELDTEKAHLENQIANKSIANPDTAGEGEEVDELDAFMAANEKNLQNSDLEKANARLAELEGERKRVQKLADIARPALDRMSAQPPQKPQVDVELKDDVEATKVTRSSSSHSTLQMTSSTVTAPATTSISANALFSRSVSTLQNKPSVHGSFRALQTGVDKRARVVFSEELNAESTQASTDDEDRDANWRPPSNQQGDGRTKANSKFGY